MSAEHPYNFTDLVDIAAFAQLMDSFYQATGVPNGLVAENGELLTQSGWTKICSYFHRNNPTTNQRCVESNLELMQKLHKGEVSCSQCQNGLIDYATPIVIENRRLATLFLGQVLNEAPNVDLFRHRAIEFGFDQAQYLAAVSLIPITTSEKMEALMMSMVSMAEMLAASGLARLHEKQMASALTRTTEKSIQLKDILDASPVGIGWSDADGNIEYMNHQFTRLFGYTLEDLPTLDVWYQKAYPDPQYRAALITPWLNTVKEAQQTGATPPKLEANVRCKDGSERYVLVSLSWSSGKRLVNFIDISERKQIENELNLREREFRTLVRNLPDIVVRYDCHARFMYVNPKFEESFGFCLNDLYGKRPTQVEGLIEAEFFEQIVLSVAKSCHPIEFEHEVLTADGTSLWGLVHITPELDDNGSVEYVQVLTRDITERRRTEKRLQAHDTMLGMVARGENLSNILEQIVRQVESENKASRCSILLLDVDGKHLLIGAAPSLPAFYNHAIHGLEIGVGVGSCGTAAALGERVVVEDIQTHEYWKNFLKLTEKAGLRACWSEPIIGSTGKVLGTFAIYHTTPTLPDPQQIEQINFAANLAAIAIENSHARTELEQRAYSDYLTGIANRRHFIEQSEIEIKRHNQTPKMITMIMFDIDFFKKINDTYGHNAGDLVLQQIAAVCRNLLPYTALFGRIGGEEFAILLPSSNREQAHAIAEQLRMSIEQTNVTTAEQDVIHFTASFGIVSTSKQVSSVDELLNHADTALYEAKENGRNRVCTAKSVI